MLILDISDFSKSYLAFKEQSKKFSPLKTVKPPIIEGSTSYLLYIYNFYTTLN